MLGIASPRMMDYHLAVGTAGQLEIQCPHLLEEGRVGGAGVLEPDHPLNGGVIAIFDGFATDLEPGPRVRVSQRALYPVAIESLLSSPDRPALEQLGG